MRIVTRVVLQPRGDGDPVEIFDSEPGDLDPHHPREGACVVRFVKLLSRPANNGRRHPLRSCG